MKNTAGLILAAGAGVRFGRPKAGVIYQGERLVDRAVRLLHESGCIEVFVVLGAWKDEVRDAHTVENPDWDKGMSTSLIAGLNAIENWNHGADSADFFSSVLITLVDLPGLTAQIYSTIGLEPAEIVVATFEGERGHPMKFERKFWGQIMASASGDIGARDFLNGRDDISFCEVGSLADGRDADFPEELAGN